LVSGLTKNPVWSPFIANVTWKVVFAGRIAKLLGLTNFALGIFEVEGMAPIGAGLQEPFLICWPFVIGRLDNVAQKLMKLLVDVKEGNSPAWEVFAF
jgi:hypothetical protein